MDRPLANHTLKQDVPAFLLSTPLVSTAGIPRVVVRVIALVLSAMKGSQRAKVTSLGVFACPPPICAATPRAAKMADAQVLSTTPAGPLARKLGIPVIAFPHQGSAARPSPSIKGDAGVFSTRTALLPVKISTYPADASLPRALMAHADIFRAAISTTARESFFSFVCARCVLVSGVLAFVLF